MFQSFGLILSHFEHFLQSQSIGQYMASLACSLGMQQGYWRPSHTLCSCISRYHGARYSSGKDTHKKTLRHNRPDEVPLARILTSADSASTNQMAQLYKKNKFKKYLVVLVPGRKRGHFLLGMSTRNRQTEARLNAGLKISPFQRTSVKLQIT